MWLSAPPIPVLVARNQPKSLEVSTPTRKQYAILLAMLKMRVNNGHSAIKKQTNHGICLKMQISNQRLFLVGVLVRGNRKCDEPFIEPYTPKETLLRWNRLKKLMLKTITTFGRATTSLMKRYREFLLFDQIRVAALLALIIQPEESLPPAPPSPPLG